MFPGDYFAKGYFPGEFFPPVATEDETPDGGLLPHFVSLSRRPEPDDPDPLGEDFFFALT